MSETQPKPLPWWMNKVALTTEEVVEAGRKVPKKLTMKQRESGDYPAGEVDWEGLSIRVTSVPGRWRVGKRSNGKLWMTKMPTAYGQFTEHTGPGGKPVKVFLGPDLDSPHVFVINQVKRGDKKFDEHKVMVGWMSEAEARNAYRANHPDRDAPYGSCVKMNKTQFKKWLPTAKEGPAEKSAESNMVDNAKTTARTTKSFLKNVTGRVVKSLGGGDKAHKLLMGTAAAESNYGTHPDTFKPDRGAKGVFQMTDVGLRGTQDVASHPKLKRHHAKIKQDFGIDWPSQTLEDMRRSPLKGAIGARLKYLNIPGDLPDTREGRAAYWKKHYNTPKDTKGTKELYLRQADPNFSVIDRSTQRMLQGSGATTLDKASSFKDLALPLAVAATGIGTDMLAGAATRRRAEEAASRLGVMTPEQQAALDSQIPSAVERIAGLRSPVYVSHRDLVHQFGGDTDETDSRKGVVAYDPKTTPAAFYAHELAHSRVPEWMRSDRVSPGKQRMMSAAGYLPGVLAGGLSGKPLFGAAVGALGRTAGRLPAILEEISATNRAKQIIDYMPGTDKERKAHKNALTRALITYILPPAVSGATVGAASGLLGRTTR